MYFSDLNNIIKSEIILFYNLIYEKPKKNVITIEWLVIIIFTLNRIISVAICYSTSYVHTS